MSTNLMSPFNTIKSDSQFSIILCTLLPDEMPGLFHSHTAIAPHKHYRPSNNKLKVSFWTKLFLLLNQTYPFPVFTTGTWLLLSQTTALGSERRSAFPLLLWPLVLGTSELKRSHQTHCLRAQGLTISVPQHGATHFIWNEVSAMFHTPGCDT